MKKNKKVVLAFSGGLLIWVSKTTSALMLSRNSIRKELNICYSEMC